MRRLAAIAATCTLLVPAAASAQVPIVGGGGPQPAPYHWDDFGGFRNILPPGEAGLDNAADLAHNLNVQNVVLQVESSLFSYHAMRALRDAQNASVEEAVTRKLGP